MTQSGYQPPPFRSARHTSYDALLSVWRDMRRRAFLRILGAAMASWPLVVHAQGERVRRIAIVMPFPPTNAELRRRGWAASVNVQFDERWTGDNMDLIRSAAANVVTLNPDVILAVGGRVVPILMELTQSIPIVNPGGTDPVGRGYAESLARPGRNVTGFAIMELSEIGRASCRERV